MPHRFDPAHADRLLSPERRQMQDPDAILDAIGVSPGVRLADVGCGPGFFTLPAAERVGDGGRVYALDVQPEMVARAEERAAEAGLGNVQAMLSKEFGLPLPDGAVDAALLANVLHESPDRVRFLSEIGRTLQPGGVIGVVDWLKEEMPMGPPLADRLSPDQVEADLRAAGFEVEGTFSAGPRHYGVKARWHGTRPAWLSEAPSAARDSGVS
jgi:ubiquinone/menaquinone biosynthesis C-methylase UbiE